MSYTETLFTEICRRGCAVQTKSKYSTIHLPQCLVTIHDYIYMPKHTVEFQMTIIPTHRYSYICFVKHESIKDRYTAYLYNVMENHSLRNMFNVQNSKYFDFFPQNDREKEMKQLDLLTDLIYYSDTRYWNMSSFNREPPIVFSSDNVAYYCKKTLKDTMITNLIELYAEKYVYITNMLSIVELRSIIINMLIILDGWHELYSVHLL